MGVDVLVALLTLIGVVVAAWFSYRVGSAQARAQEKASHAEAQKALNEAFTGLVRSLQEERRQLRHEIRGLRAEIGSLAKHIVALERELVAKGGIAPERPEVLARAVEDRGDEA